MTRWMRTALLIGVANGFAAASVAQAAGWMAAPSLNVPRELFGAAVDECGNIWVVGGWNRNGGCNGAGPMVSSVEKLAFDPQTSSYAAQWELTGITLPTPRRFHSAVVSHGFLYVLGGIPTGDGESVDYLTHVDRYDLHGGSWSSTAVPPSGPRIDAAAVVDCRGRVWFIGGLDAEGNQTPTLSSVKIFDPARPDLGWQKGPALNQARQRLGATVDAKGRIWVTGGYVQGPDLHQHLQSIEWIDPCGSNSWTLLGSSLPNPTTNDDQCSIGADGRVYVVGGWISHYWFDRTLRFSPESGAMHVLSPIAHARSQHKLVLGRDKHIYAIGGDVVGCVSTTSVEKLNTAGRPCLDDGPGALDPVQPSLNEFVDTLLSQATIEP